MWQLGRDLWSKLTGRGGEAKEPERDPHEFEQEELNPCCDQSSVHIAFRGKADDRLYVAYNRQWHEMRFYQKNGLRAFCAKCRRRLY